MDSIHASSSTDREDEHYYYRDFKFNQLSGGTMYDFPFIFSFANGITPAGTTITPTWTLKDRDGNVVLQTQETFTSKASDQYSVHKIASCDGVEGATCRMDTNLSVSRYFWETEEANPTSVPSSGITVQYAMYATPTTSDDVPAGQGEYYPEHLTVRFVDHLPEFATIHADSLADGWVYRNSDPLCRSMVSGAPIHTF